MYAMLMLWEETHRSLIVGVIALLAWMATYWVYFRYDLVTYFKKRRPARWGVDMATRKVTSGRKGLY